MRGLIAAAVLAVAGIVFFVLPLGFSMTVLCFFALAAVCAILWILERRKAKRVWRDGLLVLTLSGMFVATVGLLRLLCRLYLILCRQWPFNSPIPSSLISS